MYACVIGRLVSNTDGPSTEGTGTIAETESIARSSVTDIPAASRPSRSTVASPEHLSISLPTQHNRHYAGSTHPSPTPSPMRGPSPARGRASAPPSREPSPNPITRVGDTRAWAEQTRATAVRSPPAIFSFEEEERLMRRPMSDLTSELGSESSFTNGYSASVATSSAVSSTAHVPDDWMFPIYLTLEDLYTCKSHRFRINRHLLSGVSKEGEFLF